MMVSFKSFLAAGMMTALLLATVAAAQDEAVPDKYITDTSEGGGGDGGGSLTGPPSLGAVVTGGSSSGGGGRGSFAPPSYPPTRQCRVFKCGSYTKSAWAKTYYWWYARSSLPVGSSTSDGSIVAYPCRRATWCRYCYRCLVYKWFRTTVRVPSFCCRVRRGLSAFGATS